MKRRWVQWIGMFATLLCILWLIGLGITFQHYFFKGAIAVDVKIKEEIREEAKPMKTTKTGIHLVGLGDSLTVGTGDMTQRGYIGAIVDELANKTNEAITIDNFAINGLTSDGLLGVVEQTLVKESIKRADYIFMTIGGNDLFRGGQTLLDINKDQISELEKHYLENVREIMTQINELNNDCIVYFTGLYHPFVHLPNVEMTTEIIIGWNYQTALQLAQFPNVVFVPTYDLFQFQLQSYLSSDQFHPSREGYEQIAKRVAGLIIIGGEKNE